MEGLWGKSPREIRAMHAEEALSAMVLYPPAWGASKPPHWVSVLSLWHDVAVGACCCVQPLYWEVPAPSRLGRTEVWGFTYLCMKVSSKADFFLDASSISNISLMMITCESHHHISCVAELQCILCKDRGPDMVLIIEQCTLSWMRMIK